jgi:hypothetical protein
MAFLFRIQIVPLSRIQVSSSQLRGKSVAAKREAMRAIRNDGQPRPLIVDPDGRLLADTSLYLALKASNYDLVKVVTLKAPSAKLVRAVSRLLESRETLRREAVAFNAAFASLNVVLKTEGPNLVRELWPTLVANTGVVSIRLLPSLASEQGRRRPLDV